MSVKLQKMESISTSYFRKLLSQTVSDLEKECRRWETLCSKNDLPEEVLGDIRTAIGLTKLLLNQKLKQFKSLIDDSEFKRSEKEITCLDLQGFWDMVYNEVEKIQRNFKALEKRQHNNWEVIKEEPNQPIAKKNSVQPVSSKQVAASKSLALAARARIAEAKKKMLQQNKQESGFVIDILQANFATQKEISPKTKESNKVKGQRNDENVVIADKENILLTKQSKQNAKLSGMEEKSTASKKKNAKLKKEYGKLSCVTRSAERAALLMQQNKK